MNKHEPVFCLIDANSFYASVEALFRPDLRHTPICVLSNNDGNVVARSASAKPFVKMGEPYFKVREIMQKHGIVVFSSNYALIGDISERVMSVIESHVPEVEIYSVDESFASLTGMSGDLELLGRTIRADVLRKTGITCGVGIAGTKTLAKLANYSAKKWQKQSGGVVDLRDPDRRDKVLKAVDVGEVWGVGRRLKAHMEAMGIKKAWDLAQADKSLIRNTFSVVVEKTARELAGTPCFDLDEPDVPKQEICCGRSFGKRLKDIQPIKEAVATYVMRASEKLRQQGSLCKRLRVSMRTGMFNPTEAKYANGVLVELPYPTDDVRLLTSAAMAAVEATYREGHNYAKAEVLLMQICQRNEFTGDLFAAQQPEASERAMKVLDAINAKYGRGTLRTGGVPVAPDWAMKKDMMSPCYTTNLEQLWRVP